MLRLITRVTLLASLATLGACANVQMGPMGTARVMDGSAASFADAIAEGMERARTEKALPTISSKADWRG